MKGYVGNHMSNIIRSLGPVGNNLRKTEMSDRQDYAGIPCVAVLIVRYSLSPEFSRKSQRT